MSNTYKTQGFLTREEQLLNAIKESSGFKALLKAIAEEDTRFLENITFKLNYRVPDYVKHKVNLVKEETVNGTEYYQEN